MSEQSMSPAKIRNDAFANIQDRLTGLRLRVYDAMRMCGEKTTCEIAKMSGLDLLTVRPRVTELCQSGLAEACGRSNGQGVYRIITVERAIENRVRQELRQPEQLQLI